MHEELVNRSGGLSLPRKSVVRLTDRPDMTLDVYCGRKTTMQHMRPPSKGGKKVNIFCPGHMTKMATMPIYAKSLKKSSSPEPIGQLP